MPVLRKPAYAPEPPTSVHNFPQSRCLPLHLFLYKNDGVMQQSGATRRVFEKVRRVPLVPRQQGGGWRRGANNPRNADSRFIVLFAVRPRDNKRRNPCRPIPLSYPKTLSSLPVPETAEFVPVVVKAAQGRDKIISGGRSRRVHGQFCISPTSDTLQRP
jgi:hypothetical protein